MTDSAALLTAILADPADDGVRLVYADWLEENASSERCPSCRGDTRHRLKVSEKPERYRLNMVAGTCSTCSGTGHISDGRKERAEFIRVQVELARMSTPCDVCKAETLLMAANQEPRGDFRHGYCKLHSCERELWNASRLNGAPHPWFGQMGFRHTANWWTTYDKPEITIPMGRNRERKCVFSIARGFVSALACSWSDWHTHAAAITESQPIERVRLTTSPGHSDERMRELADKYRYDWLPTEMGPGQMNVRRFAIEMFAKEWPRIEFKFAATRTEQYGLQELPLPIIHSDFEFTARRIEQSRRI